MSVLRTFSLSLSLAFSVTHTHTHTHTHSDPFCVGEDSKLGLIPLVSLSEDRATKRPCYYWLAFLELALLERKMVNCLTENSREKLSCLSLSVHILVRSLCCSSSVRCLCLVHSTVSFSVHSLTFHGWMCCQPFLFVCMYKREGKWNN